MSYHVVLDERSGERYELQVNVKAVCKSTNKVIRSTTRYYGAETIVELMQLSNMFRNTYKSNDSIAYEVIATIREKY